MSGATQICPDCGSPLRPCKCEEEDRPTAWNSTLKVSSKRLSSRGVMKVHEDDPLKYGILFLEMRSWGWCFGRRYVMGHECGMGVAGPGAHHLFDRDTQGMVPVCGAMHDDCEERVSKVEDSLPKGWTLEKLGKLYVAKAARLLDQRRELTDAVRLGLEQEGIRW